MLVLTHRLYNLKSGEHLYSRDSNEVTTLVKLAWQEDNTMFLFVNQATDNTGPENPV